MVPAASARSSWSLILLIAWAVSRLSLIHILHEYVRGLQLLHYALVDFARTQAVPRTPVEIYSQEDLEERLCHIFDRIAYHFIRGYELGQAAGRPAA